MLVLTRKTKEAVTVIVPPSTEPTVVELVVQMTTNKATKIGFTAPIAVDIRRDNIKKGKTIIDPRITRYVKGGKIDG